jgi:hypothetical protein
MDCLQAFLANGPQTSRDIWAVAQRQGMSARALKLGKRALEIECRRVQPPPSGLILQRYGERFLCL